jgi:hypothetical protein
MEEIFKYLNDPVFQEDIQDINNSLNPQISQGYRAIQRALRATVSGQSDRIPIPNEDEVIIPGTIWLTKRSYIDYEGSEISAEIPYYVHISSVITELNKTEYVKVQPISQFTMFAGPDDLFMDDDSITGFKFIIETWNEQPITLNLLDKYIGKIDSKLTYSDTTGELSDDLKTFRKYEIQNSKYLRNSITSYLSWEENVQDGFGGVVFNYGNTPIYPSFGQILPSSSDYLAAARAIGLGGGQKSCTYEQEIGGHTILIEVIHYEELFTLVIKSTMRGLKLMNEKSDVLEASSSDDNQEVTVYRELENGAYRVWDHETDTSIRIRL